MFQCMDKSQEHGWVKKDKLQTLACDYSYENNNFTYVCTYIKYMYIYFKIENKHGKDKYQVLDRTGLAKVCLGFSGTLYEQKFGQSNNCFQCWAGWEG